MLLVIGAQYMTTAFPRGPWKAFALKRTMQGKFPPFLPLRKLYRRSPSHAPL